MTTFKFESIEVLPHNKCKFVVTINNEHTLKLKTEYWAFNQSVKVYSDDDHNTLAQVKRLFGTMVIDMIYDGCTNMVLERIDEMKTAMREFTIKQRAEKYNNNHLLNRLKKEDAIEVVEKTDVVLEIEEKDKYITRSHTQPQVKVTYKGYKAEIFIDANGKWVLSWFEAISTTRRYKKLETLLDKFVDACDEHKSKIDAKQQRQENADKLHEERKQIVVTLFEGYTITESYDYEKYSTIRYNFFRVNGQKIHFKSGTTIMTGIGSFHNLTHQQCVEIMQIATNK